MEDDDIPLNLLLPKLVRDPSSYFQKPLSATCSLLSADGIAWTNDI